MQRRKAAAENRVAKAADETLDAPAAGTDTSLVAVVEATVAAAKLEVASAARMALCTSAWFAIAVWTVLAFVASAPVRVVCEFTVTPVRLVVAAIWVMATSD